MQGWFWAKMILDLGKHWNIFKMGLLICIYEYLGLGIHVPISSMGEDTIYK
jgi:hypothetical protein